ncbi:TMEM165/GDT1 family protein [Thiocystis violacea]|uniref:TMEM165/GDT1 family protein n=1 Tax=Thiocystis violacea TaxID=13725 RepID=UPI001908D639|nr:TMEM165/GDT1 family protein [Thiocystis violacea]MBK1717758.1 hypothetical protein [Thiocystis violacea]
MTLFADGTTWAWLTPVATTFGLIFLAELGDKSQLVCITLAARHRHGPVLGGAIGAFMVLNTLAVVFGVGLARWIPESVLAGLVAILFGVFGILSLRASAEDEDADVRELGGRGIFLTTFMMILLAEMGDKTQLAVAGLASHWSAISVWIGATLALGLTSALGVTIGCQLLRTLPLRRLHQFSGVLFLILAGLALTKVF